MLDRFGGPNAHKEFAALREACAPLCSGAAEIPTMALRDGRFELLPLLPHMKALKAVLPYARTLDGNFKELMDEHVRDPWLRSWLEALAFSLSGLPAAETGTAALAYSIFDLHRHGTCLDYPRGGMGKVADVLVETIEAAGSEVHLSSPVNDILVENGRAVGVRLANGAEVKARRGVICNANVWALPRLLEGARAKGQIQSDMEHFLENECSPDKTKSFLHLHLGLNASGLDLSSMNAHFTVMDQGLHRTADGMPADPCKDRNMVAVSNPSVLDDSLTDHPDRIVVHAYGAGNEDYSSWTGLSKEAYRRKKREDSVFLRRAVCRALGLSEEELRVRTEVDMVGTPLTHQRFLRREEGTYGPTFRETLSGSVTPINGLLLAGDSTFPGIGVPAVAVSGAKAANTLVSPLRHVLRSLL